MTVCGGGSKKLSQCHFVLESILVDHVWIKCVLPSIFQNFLHCIGVSGSGSVCAWWGGGGGVEETVTLRAGYLETSEKRITLEKYHIRTMI